MRIEIEIPKEFEEHFKQDKFEDALHRLNADAHLLAGNYEKETAIMLIKAFKESKPAYDADAVVDQLRKTEICPRCLNNINPVSVCKTFCDVGKKLEIVRKGGAE